MTRLELQYRISMKVTWKVKGTEEKFEIMKVQERVFEIVGVDCIITFQLSVIY